MARTRGGSKSKAPILVAYSGGPASDLLLHFLARQRDPRRTDLPEIQVAHAYDSSSTDPKALAEIEEKVRSYGMQIVLCKLASVMDITFEYSDNLSGNERLEAFLSQSVQPSSRQEAKQILEMVLLVHLATNMGCERIYWGHTCSRLATEVFTMIAYGRGAAVPWMLQEEQQILLPSSNRSLTFVRPLRDLVDLEVEHYWRLEHKESLQKGAAFDLSNIYGLTGSFLEGLGKIQASTASTVVRTACKIDPTYKRPPHSCKFCLAPDPNTLCQSCRTMLISHTP